jgi:hypothetical protein
MRRAAVVGLGLLLVVTACTPRSFFLRKEDNDSKGPLLPAPSKEDIVKYLNENASRMHCLRCQDMDLSCSQGLQPAISLHAQMVCQQPRNFRLTAEFISKTEVELGSNQQEFWYWVRRNDPPYQFHCDYKDLERGTVRKMPFPFQPDWLLEVLGMSNFGPPDRYQMLDEPPYLKLVERTRSPQGIPVRKVIVLRRRPVQAPAPQVTAFLLLDDRTGKEICSAQIQEVQVDRTHGALVPRRVVVSWPEARAKLTMRLDTITTNVDFPPGSPAFVRRPMQGFRSYDLAAGRVDQPASLQRVGGSYGFPH